jgi:nucleotide-binding universal stress UspA family protein
MYNKIMAPLDGSELAECSLKHVEELARGCEIKEIIIFGVVELYGLGYSSSMKATLGDDFIQKAQQNVKTWLTDYLDKIASGLKQKGIATKVVMTEGNAAEEILKYAGKNNIGLIVMSTHGRSGIGKFAFGSVTDKVIHNSPVPVMMISAKSC